jgi:PKD repeat protein
MKYKIIVIAVLVLCLGLFFYKFSNSGTKINSEYTTNQESKDFTIPVTIIGPLTASVVYDACLPYLEWGDGSSGGKGGMGSNTCGAGIPESEHPKVTETHVYSKPGKYIINLYKTEPSGENKTSPVQYGVVVFK